MPYQEFLTSQHWEPCKTVLKINSIHLLNTQLKSSPEEVPEVLTTTYAHVLTPRKGLQCQDAQYQVVVPRPFLLNPKGQTKISGTILVS